MDNMMYWYFISIPVTFIGSILLVRYTNNDYISHEEAMEYFFSCLFVAIAWPIFIGIGLVAVASHSIFNR